MKKFVIALLVLFITIPLFGNMKFKNKKNLDNFLMKRINENPTKAKDRIDFFRQKLIWSQNSIFKKLKWENIGPSIQGGRITDIEVDPHNKYVIYIASASGGIWKSVDNGITWKPIFDSEPTLTIGDIAIDPKNTNIIWAGTGESNSSRSSYAGMGVFKSEDGGKTWNYMGLAETHHIGRIVVDPKDDNTVYVATIGHLYTHNPERGLYKTTDGGKTWKKILYVNDRTGCIDVAVDPKNHKRIYAVMWERDRRAWNFVESDEGSGLYKSEDGGKTWEKLTNGLPTGIDVGRGGVDICYSHPNVVYAIFDMQTKAKVEKEKGNKLTYEKLLKMTKEEFLKLDDKIIKRFLIMNGIYHKYDVKKIRDMIKDGEITPKDLANYVNDEENRLVNSKVVGPEIFRSDDYGKTWKKTNKKEIKDFYNTYGYYFGQIRVNPENPDEVYILGVPLMKSTDGGKTFKTISNRKVHADHHALWIDRNYPEHILDGNDGGLDVSYDGGKHWFDFKNIPIGQFYTIFVEKDKNYRVFGGLQDNGIMMLTPDGKWQMIFGGDGGYVCSDPSDKNIVYCEYQFGYIYRLNLEKNSYKNIKPLADIKEKRFRYNWQTPFFISNYNPLTLIYGANVFLKSFNKGDRWFKFSGDLTTDPEPQGDVPFGTITTISESPINPSIYYVGTDDGRIWISRDGGCHFNEIGENLPKKWVSRIVASQYKEGRVYVTLTGYRDDDFKSYIYVSENYGKTFKSISSNLTLESVNVIREDPYSEDILYLGTDEGIWISLNKGKEWIPFNNNIPISVPVQDIGIQKRDKKMFIGTHGRSVYKIDVGMVEETVKNALNKAIYVYKIEDLYLPTEEETYGTNYSPQNRIYFYVKNGGDVLVNIKNEKGEVVFYKILKGLSKGINYLSWNLKSEGEYALPGKYVIEAECNGSVYKRNFNVKERENFFFKPAESEESK